MKQLQHEVQDCYTKISDISSKLKQQDNDISILKEELKKLLIELAETRVTLQDIVDKTINVIYFDFFKQLSWHVIINFH